MVKTKRKIKRTTIELSDEQYFFKREISFFAETEQKPFYYFYYPGFNRKGS